MKIKAWATHDGKPTRVIAHRGASGTLPEHTIEGYRLAIEQGADVIDPEKQRGDKSFVWVQCFESEPLVRVHEATELPCYELFVAEKCAEPGFFEDLANRLPKILKGIAVDKTALDEAFVHKSREL